MNICPKCNIDIYTLHANIKDKDSKWTFKKTGLRFCLKCKEVFKTKVVKYK